MSAPPKTLAPETTRRVVQIQALTLIWMTVEAAVSLGAAWTARSPALLGFGGDSAVELLSAVVVLRRFYRSHDRHGEERAAKIAGGLLFCFGCIRSPCVSPVSVRTRRTSAQPHRDCVASLYGHHHASARKTEATTLRYQGKCSVKGGRCRVC